MHRRALVFCLGGTTSEAFEAILGRFRGVLEGVWISWQGCRTRRQQNDKGHYDIKLMLITRRCVGKLMLLRWRTHAAAFKTEHG